MKKEVLIELSNSCNLSCKMCSFGKYSENYMSIQMYEYILSKIKTQKIRFNGRGEQTLNPNFNEIISLTNVPIELNTNGIKLVNIKDSVVHVSLDSLKHDKLKNIRCGADFFTINQNIKEYLKNNTVCIIFTLQSQNIDEIVSIAEYCKKLNINLKYNYYKSGGISYDNYKHKIMCQSEKIKADFKRVQNNYNFIIPSSLNGLIQLSDINNINSNGDICKHAVESLFITYNGDVYPCGVMNNNLYGNIKEHDFEYFENQSFLKIKHPKNDYCVDCSYIKNSKF